MKGVIVYDVSNTRDRNTLVKILKDYAVRIQYSVFEFNLEYKTYKKLFRKLEKFYKRYENKKDSGKRKSIIIYLLCNDCIEKKVYFNKHEIPSNFQDDIMVI